VVRKSIQDWENVHDQDVRCRYGSLEGWVSIVINFILFLLKIVFGTLTGSVSLIADAVHTLSDVTTSIVILISFKISRKPSDASHPFGHGRMEAIATVIVALLLMVAGVEIFKSALDRMIHPQSFTASWMVILIILMTVIIKELLARFSHELGLMIESDALVADFWHHRTDAISSILVIVAFIAQRFGITYLDGAVGILVALMIGYTGWKIARRAIDDLLGLRPSKALIERVKQVARSFDQVLDVHDLIIHQYGYYMVLSFHIEVSESLSLKHAHTLAEKVEKAVNDKFHTYTTVHIDPVNTSDPELIRMRRFLNQILDDYKGQFSFHDLRTVGEASAKNVHFDLTVDPDTKDKEILRIKQKLEGALKDTYPSIAGVVIEVEPKYTF
jgi:cation diffusion facilitator family transporter